MDKSEARRAVRTETIENIRVQHAKRGDPRFPTGAVMSSDPEADEAWSVFMRTRTGLMPPSSSMVVFTDQEELTSFLASNEVGQEFEDTGGSDIGREFFQKVMSSSLIGFAKGDREDPLAFHILEDAEIYTKESRALSDEVTGGVGEERIEALKELFGENWRVAAAFEYCWLHLPHSSPAFVAASYQYHYYITEDDFSAGYLWRDLEVLVHGVEETAKKAIDRSKRAGESGSKSSTNARNLRRTSIMEALEAVSERNPDIAKLGEEPASRLALENATQQNPVLWRQGRGQVQEYLGEIRRGEAGTDLQERYRALFGGKPLRRS